MNDAITEAAIPVLLWFKQLAHANSGVFHKTAVSSVAAVANS